MRFLTSCVNVHPEDAGHLTAMIEGKYPLSYDTFRRHVQAEDFRTMQTALGYGRGTLTLKRDYHVAYYRSQWRGKTCVFLVHSAIEYIFTETANETAYPPANWPLRTWAERTCAAIWVATRDRVSA